MNDVWVIILTNVFHIYKLDTRFLIWILIYLFFYLFCLFWYTASYLMGHACVTHRLMWIINEVLRYSRLLYLQPLPDVDPVDLCLTLLCIKEGRETVAPRRDTCTAQGIKDIRAKSFPYWHCMKLFLISTTLKSLGTLAVQHMCYNHSDIEYDTWWEGSS